MCDKMMILNINCVGFYILLIFFLWYTVLSSHSAVRQSVARGCTWSDENNATVYLICAII